MIKINRCLSKVVSSSGNNYHHSLYNLPTTSKRYISEGKDVSFVSLNPVVEALKRGTGGRSSFNGHVVTVFGATGVIGQQLVSRLCSLGCQIIVPYRGDPSCAKDLKVSGDLGQVMFVPFYLRSDESIFRAVKYSDIVVNLIGSFNDSVSFTIEEANYGAAKRIATLSKLAGVKKFIYMSALNASPNPQPIIQRGGSRFLKSKYLAEQVVKENFPEAVIFRPSWIFGANDTFFSVYATKVRRFAWTLYLWNAGRGIYKMPVYDSDVVKGLATATVNDKIRDVTFDCIGPRRYEFHQLMNFVNNILRHVDPSLPSVCDLKYAPHVRLWTTLKPYILFDYPVTWDYIEYEHCSDLTTRTNPTLEDLGVNLVKLEDRIVSFLRWRARKPHVEDAFEGLNPIPYPPYEIVH